MCLHRMWSGNINRNLSIRKRYFLPYVTHSGYALAIHLYTHAVHRVTCMHNYTKVMLTWLNKNHC